VSNLGHQLTRDRLFLRIFNNLQFDTVIFEASAIISNFNTLKNNDFLSAIVRFPCGPSATRDRPVTVNGSEHALPVFATALIFV